MINIVKLTKGQVVTRQQIQRKLDSSRATFEYARFNFPDDIYIAITYHKDLKVTIATNSRDIALHREIQALSKIYTQQRAIDFMFRWVNKLNK